MKNPLVLISKYPLTSISIILLVSVDYICLKDIFTANNFLFDPTFQGLKILWEYFNIPIAITLTAFGLIASANKIDEKLYQNIYKKEDYNLTKDQKNLISQIHKSKITDFETLILKYLKPEKRQLGIPYKIMNTEYKPDDKVYVFDDPREIYLKIKSMVETLNFLLTNRAIELISKYERIDKSKTLNPFYVFTKPPTEKNYFWDKRLNDVLYENFGITDFDKEIRTIENRLKQYIT